jgi:hypothetical protein
MSNEPLGEKVGNKLEQQFEQLKGGVKDLVSKSATHSGSSAKRSGAPTAQRSGSRSRAGMDGRTKEQLYADAKRLGVKGRSKMTKAELAKAVGRR